MTAAIEEKLLAEGIDSKLRHYGIVEWFDCHLWYGHGQGKGVIKMFLPYGDKKWRDIQVFSYGILPNKFMNQKSFLVKDDFVGFRVSLGPSGALAAIDTSVIRQHAKTDYIENMVIRCMNLFRDSGYVSPFSSREPELDFFGGDIIEAMYPTVTELPKIKKAPACE